MIDRHAILATLQSLLGVPFLHQGRSRRGLDCLGVLMFVAREHGIALHDYLDYAPATDGVRLTQELQRQLIEIPIADATPADVLQWAELGSRNSTTPPCNVAFLGWTAGRLTMVHALRRTDAVTEHGYRYPWPLMVKHAYRLPDVGPWLPLGEG